MTQHYSQFVQSQNLRELMNPLKHPDRGMFGRSNFTRSKLLFFKRSNFTWSTLLFLQGRISLDRYSPVFTRSKTVATHCSSGDRKSVRDFKKFWSCDQLPIDTLVTRSQQTGETIKNFEKRKCLLILFFTHFQSSYLQWVPILNLLIL